MVATSRLCRPATGGMRSAGPDVEVQEVRFRRFFGRSSVDDSYSWGRAVRSPGSGEVIEVRDGCPDRESLHLIRDAAAMLFARPERSPQDIRPFAGNHIHLRIDSAYVFVCHPGGERQPGLPKRRWRLTQARRRMPRITFI